MKTDNSGEINGYDSAPELGRPLTPEEIQDREDARYHERAMASKGEGVSWPGVATVFILCITVVALCYITQVVPG